jgi:hypothetical protein
MIRALFPAEGEGQGFAKERDAPLRGAMPGMKLGAGWGLRGFVVVGVDGGGAFGQASVL